VSNRAPIARTIEKLDNIRARKLCPSLTCLPALIAEIDGMDHEPVGIELAYLLARFKTIELRDALPRNRDITVKMVNEYLIDVLWRSRGDRNPEKAKVAPGKWLKMATDRKPGSGKWKQSKEES